MSELDTLYLDLASKMDKYNTERENEKCNKEEADTDANEREHAIMTTMAKQCWFDSVDVANKVLADEAKEKVGNSDKGEEVGEKRPGGSYGRGEGSGQDKRAKGDPSLHLNGKIRKADSKAGDDVSEKGSEKGSAEK
eukprot:838292-Rhodomonas_salina.1